MSPRWTATPRSSSQVTSSPGSASTRTVSPRSRSAATRWRPTYPLPPVIKISTSAVPDLRRLGVGRAIPLDAAPDALAEPDLRREAQFVPGPLDDETVLAAEHLDAVPHQRRWMLPASQRS